MNLWITLSKARKIAIELQTKYSGALLDNWTWISIENDFHNHSLFEGGMRMEIHLEKDNAIISWIQVGINDALVPG